MPGGALAAVATVGSAALGKSAAKSAAKKSAAAITDSTDAANATQLQIYNDQKKLLTPGALSGAQAQAKRLLMTGSSVGDANKYLSDTYSAFGEGGAPTVDAWDPQAYLESTPGYQFQFDQGKKAVEHSAAAGGHLFSGQTGEALTRYGEDYGANYWDKLFGQLGEEAGTGQQNTGTIVNVGSNYGDSVSNNQLAAGRARASGYADAGAANANFWNTVVPGAIGRAYGAGKQTGWFGG